MNVSEETENILASVFPDLAVRWRRVAQDLFQFYGVRLKATSGFRSTALQWALYGQGRQKEKSGAWVVVDEKKVVTNALPLQSLHNYGLAMDSAFSGIDPYLENIKPKERGEFLWNEYGRFVKAHGMEWGGDFKSKPDRPHCQMRYGMSVPQIQKLFEYGGLKAVHAKCQKLINDFGQN